MEALQSKSAMADDPDFAKAVKADRTPEAADFNYRELCFSLDLWYGQPGQEWIHEDLSTMKFDEVLTQEWRVCEGRYQPVSFLSVGGIDR